MRELVSERVVQTTKPPNHFCVSVLFVVGSRETGRCAISDPPPRGGGSIDAEGSLSPVPQAAAASDPRLAAALGILHAAAAAAAHQTLDPPGCVVFPLYAGVDTNRGTIHLS